MVSALILAIVATQVATYPIIQNNGTTLGRPYKINFTGTSPCSGDNSGVTCAVGGGGGGGSPGGLSGNLQINNGAGGFGPYVLTACGAGNYVSGISASGALTCSTPPGSYTYTLPALTATVLGGVKGNGSSSLCNTGEYVHGFNVGGDMNCGVPVKGITSIQDEGFGLGIETAINFVGAGVTCADDALNSRYLCTIPANGAPLTSTYILKTADASLPNAQALGVLGTGIVKNTTTTGVLSIAVAGDFPTLNQNTSGTAATASAITPAGTTNQFWRWDNTWYQPGFINLQGTASAAQLPLASATIGGVKMAAGCGAGTHVSSIDGTGTLVCTADAGGSSPTTTALTAIWSSSSSINAPLVVGNGAVPMTSPTYAAGARFGFECRLVRIGSATNGPRYGFTATTTFQQGAWRTTRPSSATAEVVSNLAFTTLTGACATGCTPAMTTSLATTLFDVVEGLGTAVSGGTISLNAAPSAAVAINFYPGSHCVWSTL